MPGHTQPITPPKPVLFIRELESPAPAQCKNLPLPPRVTTLAIGEECYKGA